MAFDGKKTSTDDELCRNYFEFRFFDEERLFDMVMGWKNLFDAIAPDLVVFDHSPTALVASKCISAKRVIFGTGFCSPPRMRLMPTIQPWANPSLKRLQNSEKRVLQSINGALSKLGVPGLENLSDLFDCDENFLTTFKELDHYQNREKVGYWGARMSMEQGEDPVWPNTNDGPKIFAYLKGGYKNVNKVLEVLNNIEANVLVYATGFTPKLKAMFQTEKLVFSPKMLNLKKVCQNCELVICHAGHATVARALLGGIPVVMLPSQLEQFIMSVNVVRYGAATMVKQNEEQPDFAGVIHQALIDENIRQKAKEFAARHAAFDQQKQIIGIVNRIEGLIAQGL